MSKINPRHRKWSGHTLTIIPFSRTIKEDHPNLVALLELSNLFSKGLEYKDPYAVYHTLESKIDLTMAYVACNSGDARMSGFNPCIAVADLQAECDQTLPHAQDEEGNPKTWEQWAKHVYPDIEDGKRYLLAPDVQHDYFNSNGLVTTDVLVGITGAEIVAQDVYKEAYNDWAIAQQIDEQ